MQRVFVIDQNKKPLMPCQPARARQLLNRGKAAIYRRYPFTIILKEREGGEVQPIALKIDPGSKVSGIALVTENLQGQRAVWAAEIHHRGQQIRNGLLSRKQSRRSRRQRNTRYRPARFNNRSRREGWSSPSIKSRVDNILTWYFRLLRLLPISSISLELVRFDTHLMQNAEISGIEYQWGELHGYEVREYLLEKWERKCAYCNRQNIALEVEHIIPKDRGGSNRVSNLTLACHNCNQRKGNRTAAEFGYPDIQRQAKLPLKDAAAVNTTRWELWKRLREIGLPVEIGTGGRTKHNRIHQNYPKAHWIDAACVGQSGASVFIAHDHAPLIIKAVGRGSRQKCRMNKYGFPRTAPKANKRVQGFQTGDMVLAEVTEGKKKGLYIGKVAIRSSGSFSITTSVSMIQGISYRFCRMLHHADGYQYK